MLLLFHPRQRQKLLEGFCCCHVQLPQEGSSCSFCTTRFHQPGLRACNIELVNTWSETPKKMMEFHETLYCLTLLWGHWQYFLLYNHTRKK